MDKQETQEQEKRYTATVYVAAPGTPLTLTGGTSLPGHVYYSINDGKVTNSYGFAPATHGESNGPGNVYDQDNKDYKDPRYSRTMEISKEQYDKLQDFGKDPAKHNFDMKYDGAANSCIDFTWSALNHAGLHRESVLGKDKNYEGALKPLDNIQDIKSIEAPFPKSELNTERQNKLPERTPLQWLISEQEQGGPTGPGRDQASVSRPDPLVSQAEAAVRRLDAKVGREYDGQSACMAASAACLAKANGLSQIDHVLLSEARGTVRAGENMFVVQGEPGDPAQRRAQMKTDDAIKTPVEQSVAQLQTLNETQKQPPQVHAMEDPKREISAPQMRMG
jgi:type IV secretion system effector X-Tfes-like protein